ncbi:MAG: hypothetical protein K8I29_19570 [Alphaproteobacteria bacterium]|uniref:Uncharacterized protein n=1 Tax=Candidatus Nitrobium versatile TaxID=2884831 RepID=A0A953M3P1_9BACT|nr:hypothetical protein [Candidatus Nitrobium versatile]
MPSIEKIRWVIEVIHQLAEKGFEGTLMIEFVKNGEKSYPSKKYRTQTVHKAE